ncbi:alpha-galactosidase A-like isoform X2 [Drosophila bipectinata]|uniref:alpha-galactosidase A-like isoform X2 n=1 Tax=Drosophila bipectinata TaxID=42026 RepID=UPI0007E645DB|nr:alpha-galactosidase A-like isoform X2 [Drosophila bipectinata]
MSIARCHLLLLLLSTWDCVGIHVVNGLENGLARTPPMGWMPFERFRCVTDCVRFPKDCISERLIRRTANLLVSEGYAAAGYRYLIIDDCWMEASRDMATHELLPSEDRFPSGMRNLGNYIHSKGLLFGIYHDLGERTCMFQGPGAARHFNLDARTFANWGVDYVKMDGCFASESELDQGYPEFGRALNHTGRPMVYSCSWPYYKARPDFKLIAQHCNLWRFAQDIQDSMASVTNIMMQYSKKQTELAAHAGPGRWNDPDMVWIRPVTPVSNFGKKSFAIAFLNLGGFAECPLCPQVYKVQLYRLGLNSRRGYNVMDLFNRSHNFGLYKPKDSFSTRINPEGVTFYKFSVLPPKG